MILLKSWPESPHCGTNNILSSFLKKNSLLIEMRILLNLKAIFWIRVQSLVPLEFWQDCFWEKALTRLFLGKSYCHKQYEVITKLIAFFNCLLVCSLGRYSSLCRGGDEIGKRAQNQMIKAWESMIRSLDSMEDYWGEKKRGESEMLRLIF